MWPIRPSPSARSCWRGPCRARIRRHALPRRHARRPWRSHRRRRTSAPTRASRKRVADPTTHEITAPDGAARLDVLVAGALDVSRTQAATLIATGMVAVDGRSERASYRPNPGEKIVVQVQPPPTRTVTGEDIPLNVVYEDDDVLVVDKQAGMVGHPAPGNGSGTLVNSLEGRGVPAGDIGGSARDALA